MSQKWESLSVIRQVPPAYGICRHATCRRNIEWVTTTGRGVKIPVDLPLTIHRVYERQDGQKVTVIDAKAVHWNTCSDKGHDGR
jgi:hypothetical protein